MKAFLQSEHFWEQDLLRPTCVLFSSDLTAWIWNIRVCLLLVLTSINSLWFDKILIVVNRNLAQKRSFSISTTQTYRPGMHVCSTTHIEKLLEFSFLLLVEISFMPVIHKIFPLGQPPDLWMKWQFCWCKFHSAVDLVENSWIQSTEVYKVNCLNGKRCDLCNTRGTAKNYR
jgi:hypothetical protein